MDNNKSVEIYKSIKAPNELKERVIQTYSSQNNPRKNKRYGLNVLLPMAACFAVIIIAAVLFGSKSGNINVSVKGTVSAGVTSSAAAAARYSELPDELSVVLSVETANKIKLCADTGILGLSDDLQAATEEIEISADGNIYWFIDTAKANGAVLTITDKNNREKHFVLEVHSETGLVTIKKS